VRESPSSNPEQPSASDLPTTIEGKNMAKLIVGNSMGLALLAAVGVSAKNVLQVALDMGRDKATSLVITRALEVDDIAKLTGELQRIIDAPEFRERVWTADQAARPGNEALRERLRGDGGAPTGSGS
jgi:hypothetical protein